MSLRVNAPLGMPPASKGGHAGRDPVSRRRLLLLAALAVFVLLSFVLERTGVLRRWLDAVSRDPIPAAAPHTLEAHFINVGNADAIFITCDGAHMLIDAGEWTSASTVTDYLTAHGVQKLDYLVATHADADHIGGMRRVAERFAVGQFLTACMPAGYEPTGTVYQNLLTALDERHIPVTDVSPGAEYVLGEATVTVLGPVAESEDPNDQSVVCRVTHGNNRLLFVGDAGEEEEQSLLAAGVDLRADLLKVGHHGSHSSSSGEFLRAVGARVAVISCGTDNDYGHPHADVLSRLDDAGMAVWRTDRNGTVVAVSDGTTLTVTAENGG